MLAFLSQILRRFVKPSGSFPIAGSPTRSLNHVNPFWDHMAELYHVDHEHGDMLVVPSRVLAQCERLNGPSPAWVKSSDLVQELTTSPGPDRRVGAVTIAVARRTCVDCGARNLEHFYTCKRDSSALCPRCFQDRFNRGLAQEAER